MRKVFFYEILFLLLAFGTLVAEPKTIQDQALENQSELANYGTSQSQLISLNDSGLSPSSLKVRKEDSIVFFLNKSTDSLATLKVDFGHKVTHCASSNMKIHNAGIVESGKPFGPRDFASLCFHESGSYPVTVYGLSKFPKGATGTIIVE